MSAATPTYTVTSFPSATGHTWFLVWGPLGKKAEYLARGDAEAHAARLNWSCPKCGHQANEHNRGLSCQSLAKLNGRVAA